jgi:hypothetical protein
MTSRVKISFSNREINFKGNCNARNSGALHTIYAQFIYSNRDVYIK